MCACGLILPSVYCLFGGPEFERYRGFIFIEFTGSPTGSPQLDLAFYNSKVGVSCFFTLVRFKYLHQAPSVACWDIQNAVMLGSFGEHFVTVSFFWTPLLLYPTLKL